MKNSSFKEDVIRDNVDVDGERQGYEEKLRIMREELDAKYNDQMDGMKKREASNTLRVNTKLACVARQRDEMETKLHLVEKKYDNMKRHISTMVPTMVNSTFETKNVRGFNDAMSKTESVTELGSAKSEKYPNENMVGSEKILQSFEKWMEDIYGVVNDMRAEMTEMKDVFLTMSTNFEKFQESHGGDVMKISVAANETEHGQDEHQFFETKPFISNEAEASSSTALRQDEVTDERLVSTEIIPKKLSEGLFSTNCSVDKDERLNDRVEIRPDENKGKESNKNDKFAESLTNESLTQNEITCDNKSEQEKTNSDMKYKVVPTDLSQNYDSNHARATNPSRNGSRYEDSGSEWDLEDNCGFNGADMEPQNVQRNDDFSFDSIEDEAGPLQQRPTALQAIEHECATAHARISSATGGNKQRKKASSVCCLTCKFDREAYRSGLPQNCPLSHADNSRNYQTQNGCMMGKCCRCSKEITSANCIQKCSCCISKNSSRVLVETCPRHQKKWARLNSSCGSIELNGCCRSVGSSQEMASRDHVQRHVVKSSAIIANLRDLKPDEVWM